MYLYLELIDFYQPLKEDEFEQSTVVDIIYPAEPPVSLKTNLINCLDMDGVCFADFVLILTGSL